MIDGDHIAKAAVQDAAGAFEVFEVIAPAASMAPPHVSPWTGVLYLVEGRVTVGESARFVAITSGAGAGRFFADFASSVPVDQPVEDSMAAILSVTRRHGVALTGA